MADEINDNRSAANTLERVLPELLNATAFASAYQKRIRKTNSMERINKELKRRKELVGAFPSDAALRRLTGAYPMNINEVWETGKGYFPMNED